MSQEQVQCYHPVSGEWRSVASSGEPASANNAILWSLRSVVVWCPAVQVVAGKTDIETLESGAQFGQHSRTTVENIHTAPHCTMGVPQTEAMSEHL